MRRLFPAGLTNARSSFRSPLTLNLAVNPVCWFIVRYESVVWSLLTAETVGLPSKSRTIGFAAPPSNPAAAVTQPTAQPAPSATRILLFAISYTILAKPPYLPYYLGLSMGFQVTRIPATATWGPESGLGNLKPIFGLHCPIWGSAAKLSNSLSAKSRKWCRRLLGPSQLRNSEGHSLIPPNIPGYLRASPAARRPVLRRQAQWLIQGLRRTGILAYPGARPHPISRPFRKGPLRLEHGLQKRQRGIPGEAGPAEELPTRPNETVFRHGRPYPPHPWPPRSPARSGVNQFSDGLFTRSMTKNSTGTFFTASSLRPSCSLSALNNDGPAASAA